MRAIPVAKVTVILEYADGHQFTATAPKARRIELTLDPPPFDIGPFDPWAQQEIPVPSSRHMRLEFDVEPSGGPVTWVSVPGRSGTEEARLRT